MPPVAKLSSIGGKDAVDVASVAVFPTSRKGRRKSMQEII
jgi:hypothetical protein